MLELEEMLGVMPGGSLAQLDCAFECYQAVLQARAWAGDRDAGRQLLDLRLAYLRWAYVPGRKAAETRTGGERR